MGYELYLNFVKKYLSQKRVLHSIGVAETASKLAVINNCDQEKAYLAGLLHDVARELTHQEAIAFLKRNNYSFIEEDYLVPEVLHGHISALMLEQELKIKGKDILQAVKRHTTGAREMTVLDAIVFVSDMIEPSRNYPGVQELRVIAQKDLTTALHEGLKQTIEHLLDNNRVIHPYTLHTYNWILNKGQLLKEEE